VCVCVCVCEGTFNNFQGTINNFQGTINDFQATFNNFQGTFHNLQGISHPGIHFITSHPSHSPHPFCRRSGGVTRGWDISDTAGWREERSQCTFWSTRCKFTCMGGGANLRMQGLYYLCRETILIPISLKRGYSLKHRQKNL
jgi:hypothetical protein